MDKYDKPIPKPNVETQAFWDACKRKELVIQRCKDCNTFRHYPRPMCHNCGSLDVEWVKVSGQGTVFSYSVVNHPVHASFTDVPYAFVLIELPDAGGVHLVSDLIDCPPEEIFIGMPVEVVFEDITEEITIPRFRRVT